MPNISRELAERRGMFSVGVDTSKTTWEFGRTIGHCGASDPVLSLDHLLTNRQLNPGDHFMMLSSGAGVVVACSIIRILDTPPWL
jgi:3-oxoacyl-[acyl-carrier-protein] synthase-3/clorobiocin biosynthesis protein CloN2